MDGETPPDEPAPKVDTRSYEKLDPPEANEDTMLSMGMELKGTSPGEEVDLSAVEEEEDEDSHRLEGKLVAVRYKVLRKIGEGGMGSVYLAEHVTIQKKIALKVLLHEFAKKEVIKQRFLQEAKAAAKIGHENIVDIIDFGSTPTGSLFFAMEYLDGDDLSKVLQMNGAMIWGRAKPILLQVCRALEAAHSKGIIHRDMKPENVFLEDREGKRDFVKILDFGIAKVGLEGEEGANLTRTGMVFGTPHYMSPEQAMGKKPDNRVDIYSLGVIMYEMLTGEVPFNADSFMGILTRHISDKPTPPRELREDIPVEVEAIVLKALAKKPEDRYQSMAELAVVISRVAMRANYQSAETIPPVGRSDGDAGTFGPPADTVAALTSGSRRWVAVAGLTALLLGGSMAVMSYLKSDTPRSWGSKPPPVGGQTLKQDPPGAEPKHVARGAGPATSVKAAAPASNDAGVAALSPDITVEAKAPAKPIKTRRPRRPRRPRKIPKKVTPPAKTAEPKKTSKPPSELIEPKW